VEKSGFGFSAKRCRGSAEGKAMADDDPLETAQVEIICRCCGYHMLRTAQRLRRDIDIVCPNCGTVVVGESEDNDA
jgi:hypothetical protein